MSAGSSEFVEFVKDQLAALRGVSAGRFFGGVRLAFEGTQFAMIMGGTLYFLVDDSTRPEYERMGGECFSFDTKNGRVDVRKYHAVPADVIEDQDRFIALARESARIALRSKANPTSGPTRTRARTRAPR